MQYNQFGNTGLQVSQVGLGTWAMGNDFFGQVEDGQSIRTIRAAVEAGINIIDTAPAYGAGHAEEVVGRAVKGIRDKVYISTKVGTVRLPGKFVRDLSPAAIRAELDNSLRRLGVDCIDIWLLHWPDVNVPLEDTAQTVAELKKTGKFRHFGVSNFSMEQIDTINKYVPVEVLQPQYSILVRDKERLIADCAARGIGIMSYGALAGGILTGKYTQPPQFEETDTRSNFYPFFKEPLWDKTAALLETLRALSGKTGHPMSEIAINYASQHAGVGTSLVGAKTEQQAQANAAAASWTLSDEDRAAIDAAYQANFNA